MSEKTLNFIMVLILGSAGIGIIESYNLRKRPDLIRIRLNDLWADDDALEILKAIIS